MKGKRSILAAIVLLTLASAAPLCCVKADAATSRTWGHDSVGTASAYKTWFLAEGCTAGGFETWILVQNPFDQQAGVHLTYMTPEGPKEGPSATLPAGTRTSFNVANTVPNAPEVSTRVSADNYVIAERAMYGPGRAWGHDSIGSPTTSTKWYLAEGCTAGGFETWVLVQNPGNKSADVSLTYMTPQGPKPGPAVKLAPYSRRSFSVSDSVGNTYEVSTLVSSSQHVVAERAVYWDNRKGGHESIGVTTPEKTWYLAEGSTAAGFETYVLIQNPGKSAASVDLTFMTDNGPAAGPHLNLPPHSRKTVNVADFVPDNFSVSTKVTSNRPVIAERAVYWNNRIEGHDSIGVTEAAVGWALAEGSTGDGFETWVLVQNPNSTAASIEIMYMTPGGAFSGPAETIGAHSRKSFNVADTMPGEMEVSTLVLSTNGVKVIAERAMYGDPK